jgi:chorismate mutase
LDESHALKLLQKSREQIDVIDEEILTLIAKRTSMARDVINAKIVLDIELQDNKREEYIENKTRRLARENNIDEDKLSQIMKILIDLNKKEQEQILRRKYNG